MDDLQFDLKEICDRNRDGSYATQANRLSSLNAMAADLKDMGYRNMSAQSLKPKHVEALVEKWKGNELSEGTIKNRMAHLRWWADKVNKSSVIARDNTHYGIANRVFVTNISKSAELTEKALNNISDPYLRVSLELQREFGLRREEALKINPSWANQKEHLRLKDSWTKGGRPRTIPIRTESQREIMTRAQSLAGRGSMIPANRSYIQQLRLYEKQTSMAGLSKMHGLRHQYAQSRYEELTGFKAPAAGGPSASELSEEQKSIDNAARLIISQELGHNREQITAVYLGR